MSSLCYFVLSFVLLCDPSSFCCTKFLKDFSVVLCAFSVFSAFNSLLKILLVFELILRHFNPVGYVLKLKHIALYHINYPTG